MRCDQCRFFTALREPWSWRGSCNIKLPPGAITDKTGGYAPDTFTRGDSGCDLGKKRKKPEEIADEA
jgi:hypothetical protein